MKKLSLRKETLAELDSVELTAVAGGGTESQSCPFTYHCVHISDRCFNSYVCDTHPIFGVSIGCGGC